MRKTIIILAVLGLFAACKPSETHYKEAYESAIAKRDRDGGMESTVYNRYRDLAKHDFVKAGDDSLAVVTEFIGITSDADVPVDTVRKHMKPYNIVVGSFKQIFNAREMRRRLADGGYAFPFVVHTREPLYYVVSETCSTPAEAAEALSRVSNDTIVRLRPPHPFVLLPAHLKNRARR